MRRPTLAIAVVLAATLSGCLVQRASLTRLATNALYAGEIHNFSNGDILGHNLTVDFLDKDGKVLESQTVIPCLRSLQHGATDFFEAQHNDPAHVTTSVRAVVSLDSTLKSGVVVPAHLTLSSVAATERAGTVTVTGTASNSNPQTIAVPKACAIARSSSGSVLRVVPVAIAPPLPLGNTQPAVQLGSSDLGPGMSRSFNISFTPPNGGPSIALIDVYADGFQDATPITPVSVTGLPLRTQ